MKIRIILVCLAFFTLQTGLAQNRVRDDFEPVCKSLDTLVYERTSVRGKLKLRAVMKRGRYLDFYFSNSLSDLPWTLQDSRWFRNELKKRFPEKYRNYSLGQISSRGEKIEDLVTGELHYDGKPATDSYRVKAPATVRQIVERKDALSCPEGLDGRHIALWQSHGLYYEQSEARWEWQRPCLFQTVEDLYTQSYVLPFLVPMLENAGAYVFLPRERDLQTCEIIIDNDPNFRSREDGGAGVPSSEGRGRMRLAGQYDESGLWEDAGEGFADALETYTGTENPFRMGTARMAECVAGGKDPDRLSEIIWTPDIPERGEYAVYVSYKTLPLSTEAAHYTVRHLGGRTEFLVNQKMGGGTWIYLGTFEFGKGTEGYVTLDNIVPEVRRAGKKAVVTADAVKIGGGYGNIARKAAGDGHSVPETSGMPRFTEAARYWLQWAGIDSTVFSLNESEDDYKDDFMCRGDWSAYLSGGSSVNPGEKGLKVPVDLTFALHSDAGTTPNDSTVGTLAIYTLKSEGRRRLPSGEDRSTSREFANLVQSQIVRDIRESFDPSWNRRYLWDRGYRESRTPASPAMLCELLSHQNFADMKYGLDPAFRFTVSRAIYKGMLKYLSNRYGCSYTVQPLPVNSFAATFHDGRIRLSWEETEDRTEPTAKAEGYLLQTRMDDGAFDNGVIIEASGDSGGRLFHDLDFIPGHLYSFRITAFNSGGKSFPSETLSVGTPLPEDCPGRRSPLDSCIIVVNNFNRVSAPTWFDFPGYAGFDNRTDSGVPYMKEIAFTGEMYQHRRDMPWISDDCPGFGASYNNFSGTVIAGNTFDYPSVHGKALLEAGYPFCSSSAAAFCSDSTIGNGKWCLDLICGKQVTVKSVSDSLPDRYRVFPERLRLSLEKFASEGGDILVSGADIGTDIWSSVYPVTADSLDREASVKFAEDVLGYRFVTNYAGRTGNVVAVPCRNRLDGLAPGTSLSFNNRPDAKLYSVETPDGIAPAGPEGKTFLRYEDTKVSAGVCADFGNRKVVSIGFPIEIITDEKMILRIIGTSLDYFKE